MEPSRTVLAHMGDRAVSVSVYARDELSPGTRLEGPAIITEYSSTTLVPGRFKVEVDPWLNLVIDAT